MKKIDDIVLNIAVFVLLTGIYLALTNVFINFTYFAVIGTVIVGVIALYKTKYKLACPKIFAFLFSINLIFFISGLVFFNSYGFKYAMYFFIGNCLFLFLYNIPQIENILLKQIKLFSIVFSIVTIISPLFESFFLNLYATMFPTETYEIVTNLYKVNSYSGIAGQTRTKWIPYINWINNTYN